MNDATPTHVAELAVNLDDVSPQVIASAQQRLIEAGALDVWTVPIGMKKQRPGIMLCLLCRPEQVDRFAALTIELTGSFGLRYETRSRFVLDRSLEPVSTRYGTIRVKVGRLGDRVVAAAPEYEDVAALAREHDLPLPRVMQAAEAAACELASKLRGEDGC